MQLSNRPLMMEQRKAVRTGVVWIITGLLSLLGLMALQAKFPEFGTTPFVAKATQFVGENKHLMIFIGAAIESIYLLGTYVAGSFLILLAVSNIRTLSEYFSLYTACNAGIFVGLAASCLLGRLISQRAIYTPSPPNFGHSLHPNIMAVYCFSESQAGGMFFQVMKPAFLYLAASSLLILPLLSVVAATLVTSIVENPFSIPLLMIILGVYTIAKLVIKKLIQG